MVEAAQSFSIIFSACRLPHATRAEVRLTGSMSTRLEFTVGDRERHGVVYTWDQFTGRLRITVDDREVVSTMRMFSISSTAEHVFVVGDAERHEVRISKERPIALAAFRPQPITAYVDGHEVARTEGTMRRGQTVGVGVLIGVLFVGGMTLEFFTRAH
jgi:Arc/MetJ family transcription regulator